MLGFRSWYSTGPWTLKFRDVSKLEGSKKRLFVSLPKTSPKTVVVHCGRGVAIILGKIRHPATGSFAPRWLNSRWSTSCPSSSVPSNSCSATVPTWRPWRESRTWSHACWRPWKLWAIQLRQLWNSRRQCCGKSLRSLCKWMDVFFLVGGMGEIFLWYYLICFSTECLEKLGAFATGVSFFWKNTLGTTDKTHDLGMLLVPCGLMVLVGNTARLWLHSPSRRFAMAALTNRRCSLCARAGRWSCLTLKPSKPWGRLSRWRCMVPFRDACNMEKAQWMKTPTTLHCRRPWEAMWTCTRRVMCLWFAIDLRQGMTTAPWHCLGLIERDFVYTNIIAQCLLFLGFCIGGVELIRVSCNHFCA